MQKTIGKIGIIAVCVIGLAGCAASHSGPDKHEVVTAYREYLNKRFGAIPKDTKNRAAVIRFLKKTIHVKGCRPSKKLMYGTVMCTRNYAVTLCGTSICRCGISMVTGAGLIRFL